MKENALDFAEQRSYKPVNSSQAVSRVITAAPAPAPAPTPQETYSVPVSGVTYSPSNASLQTSNAAPSNLLFNGPKPPGKGRKVFRVVFTFLGLVSLIAASGGAGLFVGRKMVKSVVETKIVTQTVSSTSLAGANLFTCRVGKNAKGVTCSGLNNTGQLGSTDTSLHTVNILEDKPVSVLGTGRSAACAATSGQVYCWGDNSSGVVKKEVSQMEAPALVLEVHDEIVALTVGAAHACAATKVQVYCWGDTSKGQIENGGEIIGPKMMILDLKDDTAAFLSSSGYVTWLQTESGKMWAWGNNSMEEMVGKDKADHVEPTQIG